MRDPRLATITDARGLPFNLPSRLYKFLKGIHAQKMLEWGAFRIGTLYEYRDAELYKGLTLDRHEGELHHTERVMDGNALDITEYSRGFIGGDFASLRNTHIENLELRRFLSEQNYYIYCASLSPSWDGDIDNDYEVCIEIVHVAAFFSVLSQKLISRGLAQANMYAGQVEYTGREHTTVTNRGLRSGGPGVRPGLLKPAGFASQREYRALYTPLTEKVEPLTATDPRIKKLVRRHSFRPQYTDAR